MLSTAEIVTALGVAVALGADAFSLCLGLSMSAGVTRSYRISFIALVTFLHIAMPLLGLKLGTFAGRFLGSFAAWVGAAILVYIGLHMVKDLLPRTRTVSFAEARRGMEKQNAMTINSPATLLLLGLSVSMDALTVGFSLGTMGTPILLTAVFIGIIAGSMTAMGFSAGRVVSQAAGDKAKWAGAVILVALAIKMVI
jgi:putative Mn2+ efflux pump MntP